MILADGEELSLAHPDSFCLPPLDEREDLKKGMHVKLIFDDAERMWVKVVERICIDEKVVYKGHLANHPTVVDLKFGDEVVFEPKHVVDIFPPEPEDD